ncbi:SpoIIE family protein phosphatase [Streptomyces sp. Ag109_G2-15]|uniref:SpoIIE family protein phosphatase n=1 Tax=Streptomyces sp. Ag109_G2-15 TaxID=1938850 RepID=UPI0026D32A81|nr:SpoIIE family protein phosphatase [Streptomyces sp. Ag109_G2-15]
MRSHEMTGSVSGLTRSPGAAPWPAPVTRRRWVTAPDGQVAPLDLPAGPPPGLGGLPFEAREIELAEASLLCLYTNGVIGERHIDADTALTKLGAALTRPADALERTCRAVVDSLVPSRPSDDVASWPLPLEPASLPGRRTRVLHPRDTHGCARTPASAVSTVSLAFRLPTVSRSPSPG